jgi:outer membrane protein
MTFLAFGAAFAAHAQAPAPTKIGVIHVQEAILSTKDGQKAAGELQAKFAPKRSELEKKQNDIASLQDQLRKGSATMSDDAKGKLMRDIDSKNTSLKRDSEDFDADVQQDEGKLMQELGAKMMKVLDKYAADNGFAVIIDVSNPQTDVLWRATSSDITADIIALYDKANPVAGGAPSAAPATQVTRPAAPAGGVVKTPGAPPAAPPSVPKK